MHYIEGILSNYLKAFPSEMERLFEAIEYILNQGNGGDMLTSLARRSFRDTDQEYLNRIRKEALAKEEGVQILCRALLKWYETWKASFHHFNIKNADVKFQELPIHTWLHCLLTGQMPLFHQLNNEVQVVIDKSKWEEAQRGAERAKKSMSFIEKEEKSVQQSVLVERLVKLYEVDEDTKNKEKLLNKKVAFFLEDEWSKEQLEDLIRRYHFSGIKQYSSITPINDIGNFDYYVFLTAQASHTAVRALESKVASEKRFLVSSTNIDRVMEEWILQLKGK